jgi:ABC-type uncharacterized transport system permease subunit
MSIVITFIQKAISQGISILFGATGEIVTEKSGNLNLGIPGLMYMGGIAGLVGAFFYENTVSVPVPFIGMLISFGTSLVCAGFGALIYSFLTISLRANQNVVGLALTTFGIGFGNFFGGSISKLAGGVGAGFRCGDCRCVSETNSRTEEYPGCGKITFFIRISDLSFDHSCVSYCLCHNQNKSRAESSFRG